MRKWRWKWIGIVVIGLMALMLFPQVAVAAEDTVITLTGTPETLIYGCDVSLTATLKTVGGDPISGRTVRFRACLPPDVNDVEKTTNSSGQCSVTYPNVKHSYYYGVFFDGDVTYNESSSGATFGINWYVTPELSVSNVAPEPGEVVTVNGEVLPPYAEGKTVTVYKKEGGGNWELWKTLTLDADSKFSFTHPVDQDFQVKYECKDPDESTAFIKNDDGERWERWWGAESEVVTVTIGGEDPTLVYAWYLAEGSTGADATTQFETWILIANPTNETAKVAITYQTPEEQITGPTFNIEAGKRETVNVADTVQNWSVSSVVKSDQKIVVERAMYWNGRVAGHTSLGVNEIGKKWMCTEGSTNGGFETWVLIQNPTAVDANAQITYLTETEELEGPSVVVKAGTRMTIYVADTVPDTWSVSTMVEADRSIIVERATYWNGRTGGTESAGYLMD